MVLENNYVFEISGDFIKQVDEYYVVLFRNTHKYLVFDEEQLKWYQALKDKKTIEEVFIAFSLSNKQKQYLDFLSDLYWAQSEKTNKKEYRVGLKYDLTYKCNTNCAHCFLPSFHSMKEISLDQWKQISDKILSHLPYKPDLGISGGEALLFNDMLKELITYVRPRVNSITLLTNGFIFGDWVASGNPELQFYLDNIDDFQISLDAYDEENFDAIRGKGNYKRLLTAIKYLDEHNIIMDLHATVSMQNMKAIEEGFIPFVQEHNLYMKKTNHFSFSITRPLGNARNLEMCSTVEYEKFLTRLQKKINEYYPKNFLNTDDIMANTVCGIGRQITVSPNGLCYMCGISTTEPFCNILEEDMDEILERYRSLPEQMDQKHIAKCQDCELSGFCVGLCRVVNKMETGSYTDVKCDESIKEEYYRSIVREKTLGLPY